MRKDRIAGMVAVALAAVALAVPPGGGAGGAVGVDRAATSGVAEPPPTVADSVELHDRARDAQRGFERARVRFSSLTHQTFGGRCDEHVGRFCVRLDESSSEWTPPPEDPRITDARDELLGVLEEVAEALPGDSWVLGQRLAYLIEAGRREEALLGARSCVLAADLAWWCRSLEGMALHVLGDFDAAERAFERARVDMPEDLRSGWEDLRPIVAADLQRFVRDASGDSLALLGERLWRLSDPLFLVPGNDRRTEHYARHVLARIRSEGDNPYGMRWGDDMAELLVRYGPEVAYQREIPPPLLLGPTPVVGRFDPASRSFLPGREALERPAELLPGEWTTDQRRARSLHAPTYAPRIGPLEVREARFPRGDDVLFVVSWRAGDLAAPGREAAGAGTSPSGVDASPVEVGLFLLAAPTLAAVPGPLSVFRPNGKDGRRGVAAVRAPVGRYLLSLEVLDARDRLAWRARHGVRQDPVPRGVVALSDLLLLEPSGGAASDPGVLEDHLERVLPPGPVEAGPVELAWEMQGVQGTEGPLTLRLAAAPTGGGLLRRIGELLSLVDPSEGVTLSWTEEPPEAQTRASSDPVFRRTELDLSHLPPGPVHITLELELPGRTEVRSEIVVDLDPPTRSP